MEQALKPENPVDFLQEFYPTKGPEWCAEKLGKTIRTINWHASSNKISPPPKNA